MLTAHHVQDLYWKTKCTISRSVKSVIEIMEIKVSQIVYKQKSTYQISLCKCLIIWWAHLESNQAPTDYESVALTE